MHYIGDNSGKRCQYAIENKLVVFMMLSDVR
nr:MAG TPA_asm: hypothetical protein [Caudoviricetes sp.]